MNSQKSTSNSPNNGNDENCPPTHQSHWTQMQSICLKAGCKIWLGSVCWPDLWILISWADHCMVEWILLTTTTCMKRSMKLSLQLVSHLRALSMTSRLWGWPWLPQCWPCLCHLHQLWWISLEIITGWEQLLFPVSYLCQWCLLWNLRIFPAPAPAPALGHLVNMTLNYPPWQ